MNPVEMLEFSLVDSGTTHSILSTPFPGLKRKQISLQSLAGTTIAGGEGNTTISVKGLKKKLKLTKAIYVPNAQRSIIAERDIISNDYTVVHNKHGKFIIGDDDIFNKWLIENRSLKCDEFENGLYGIHVVDKNLPFIGNLFRRRTDIHSDEYLEFYMRLHENSGHAGHRILVDLANGNSSDLKHIITGIPPRFKCDTCDRCKVKHRPYKVQKQLPDFHTERLHADVAGPFEPPTKEGYKYFQMIVNETTREPTVRLLKKKSHAANELINYVNMHDRQNKDKQIQEIGYDNGELKSHAFEQWCSLQGILIRPTIPYEKQSNGMAEQHIFATEQKARCMMDQANLPPTFWGWAIKHAAFVRSLLPSTHFRKSPFEIRTGKIPETEFLKPFGCLVYVFIPKEHRGNKITTTYREKKIYIGNIGTSQIIAADPSTLKITRHRYLDCKFHTDIFPKTGKVTDATDWLLVQEDPEILKHYESDTNNEIKQHLEMKVFAASSEAHRLLPDKNKAPPEQIIPEQSCTPKLEKSLLIDKGLSTEELLVPKNLRIDMTDNMLLTQIFPDKARLGDRTRSKRRRLTELETAVPTDGGLTSSSTSGASAQAETSDVEEVAADDTLSLRNDKDSSRLTIDPVKGANSKTAYYINDVNGSLLNHGYPKKRKRHNKSENVPYSKANVSFSNGSFCAEEISVFNCGDGAGQSTTKRRSWDMRPAADILAEVHNIVMELEGEIPKNINDVMKHPCKRFWIEAIKTELHSLVSKGVWRVTEIPPNRMLIGCRWVFAIKKKSNGEIERYKARLVAQGYSQEEGIDYDEIYSPVIRQATLRYILSFCMTEGLEIELADIETAFLYGDIDRLLFMKTPPGNFYDVPKGKCLELLKAIYGLKQAGRQWFVRLSDYLIKHGFVQGTFDKCIFIKRWTKAKDGFDDVAIIGIYVDDIILGGSKRSITEVKKLIFAEFKGKALGKISYMLGIIMDWKNKDTDLYLHQKKYINEVLKKFRMNGDDVRIATIPIQPNVAMYAPRREDEESLPSNIPYRSAVGALFYLLITRPDISFAMSILSQHCENPTARHWNGILQVMRYLKGTSNLALKFKNERGNRFVAYSDASYNLHHDSRGQGGYVVYHNENPISFWSGKQRINGLSSTDDEIFALNECVRELKALQYSSNDLGHPIDLPIKVYVDSQPCISAMKTGKRTKRNKHLDPRMFYVHELINDGFIELVYIPTKDQAADILTKPLGPKEFIYIRDKYYMTRMYTSD